MTNWTEEQLEAINKTGSNIIVSAGAGSGKTTVLTERVITKLKSGIKLNELLILTFTNNSAQDMRKKIKEAIEENDISNSEDNNVDNSYIMTFDAYVLFLVKKYHYLLNLDNDINIIDSSVIELKKKDILDNIFDQMYNKNDQCFIKLVTDFCAKNDSEIKRLLLNLDKNMDLIIKKDQYLKQYINNYYNENNITDLFNQYYQLILKKIDSIKECLTNLGQYIDNDYYNKTYDLLYPIFNITNYDQLLYISSIKLQNLPRGSSDEAKLLKSQLTKLIEDLVLYTSLSKEEYIIEVLETKNHAEVIVDILINLNKQIMNYKKEHNCFEFNDISRLAISLLENNNDILDNLKYHFKEIMIDEYQDTNDVQEVFISMIENDNVYMVGDIKQSIYRFRNANPSIFKNKYDLYKNNINGQKIDLNRNFRSRFEVVNIINQVFNNIMDDQIGNADYSLEHQMVFGNKNYNLNSPSNYDAIIWNYNSTEKDSKDEIEAFMIAQDIQNKVKNKYQVLDKKNLRDCKYSDFCILMDRTTAFDTYKKAFDYMQIPLNIYKDDNILLNDETMLIKNILTFILKIKKQDFDAIFKFCYTSIARSYLFEETDENIFLNVTKEKIFHTEIYKISLLISKDIDYISNKDLIEKIIFDFDFYKKIIKVGNIDERNIVLNNILEKAIDLNKVGVGIYGLEDYLNTLIESNSEIKISNILSDKDAVVITNIHKSKGLEYHICYFSGLYKRFNLRDSFEKIIFSKEYGIILPNNKNGIKNTFIYSLYKDNYIEEEISEKIRLFYVSLTRCKEKMIILASFNEKKLNYSNNLIVDYLTRYSYRSFLDILSSIYIKIDKYISNIDYEAIPKNYLSKKDIKLNLIENHEKILVNEIDISVEKLTKKRFSKSDIDLITTEEKHNIDIGNKIHYILEHIDFNKPNLNNLSDLEKEIITSFLNQPIMKNISQSTIVREYQFNEIREENYFSGIIDLMLVYDTHIDIIDYKLKYTDNDNYIKQLNGYKDYIQRKTNKNVNIYLYSLLDQKLVEIN